MLDYNAKLSKETAVIRDKVRQGMLPLADRTQALDVATSEYAVAQADHFATLKNPPIAFRDSNALDRCADLLMYEYLTWSHADKMSIDETPILSRHQEKLRRGRESSISDVFTGKDDETIGRKRDGDGIKQRIYDYMTPVRDVALVPAEYLDLYDALDNAGLTDRQAEALRLVYFESLTQEDAGDIMGVNKSHVNRHISAALRKLRRYMT